MFPRFAFRIFSNSNKSSIDSAFLRKRCSRRMDRMFSTEVPTSPRNSITRRSGPLPTSNSIAPSSVPRIKWRTEGYDWDEIWMQKLKAAVVASSVYIWTVYINQQLHISTGNTSRTRKRRNRSSPPHGQRDTKNDSYSKLRKNLGVNWMIMTLSFNKFR